MPIDRFIAEMLDVLETDADEILVEAAKPREPMLAPRSMRWWMGSITSGRSYSVRARRNRGRTASVWRRLRLARMRKTTDDRN
jgi:hypothetical protein